MANTVIEVNSLCRRFRKHTALDQVSLRIEQGTVLGLVGENGAGKTTLIKHMLGLFKAQCGTVRVFGLDPVLHPKEVLSRIGYLSEDRDMPEWMTIQQYMTYTQAFYPTWDTTYADSLISQFALDTAQKIKHLSRGQRAKTGLLMALAYKPDLLLFDEPSSGLDPVVRRDMLGAIVRNIAEEGRTVVLSSHLLDEVERVADTICMIHQGQVILSDPMEQIRSSFHKFTLILDAPDRARPALPGLMICEGGPVEWSMICKQDIDSIKQAAKDMHARIVDLASPTLDDVFVANVKGQSLTTRGQESGVSAQSLKP
ncbi:MAG: ABC transporter ATP-binding protein [Phycisphaerae bacterium]|nr:ABC transporter ATP-binding protein [Phycisphaerae bacterium]